MNKYQILAVDMDGTLLNSKKVISKKNIDAINKAYSLGKIVVISTGRSVGELWDFFPLFPQMRYCISESGSCLYDIKAHRAIHQMVIDKDAVEKVVSYARVRDIMPQIYINGEATVTRRQLDNMDHYQMGHYKNHFRTCTDIVDNAFDECERMGYYAEKICLYHTDNDARNVTLDYVNSLNLNITKAFSEFTSLEVTPVGADKGSALEILCRKLNIPIEETIGMGDSENDLTILDKAGLAVAVENAADIVKRSADVISKSNDENGVAEIIEKYLL